MYNNQNNINIMNVKDIILNAKELFENAQKEINEYYKKTGSEVGPILDYTIIDDSIIELNYGWCDYEEGENSQVKINFTTDDIKIEKNTSGSCVMCDNPYSEDSSFVFFNEDDFFNWLIDDIG